VNVSTRWGLSPKSRQIRPIVERLKPERCAIEARDQCVASTGVCSSVATTTSSIRSSPIEGGRPGRSSSINPSSRLRMNRVRHLVAVVGCTLDSTAMSLLDTPAAQPNTILHRSARACDDFARRDHRSNCARSAAVRITSAGGRPVRAISAD
jgi:hypothetical protein